MLSIRLFLTLIVRLQPLDGILPQVSRLYCSKESFRRAPFLHSKEDSTKRLRLPVALADPAHRQLEGTCSRPEHVCQRGVPGNQRTRNTYPAFLPSFLARLDTLFVRCVGKWRQNGRISGRSQVYLLRIRERDTHCCATRGKTVIGVHYLIKERKSSWLEYLIRRK